jgi:hypothetical protein
LRSSAPDPTVIERAHRYQPTLHVFDPRTGRGEADRSNVESSHRSESQHRSRTHFDRKAELAYVKRYVGKLGSSSTSGYNRKYQISESANPIKQIEGLWNPAAALDDCTNFVSQALHAGGWRETKDWRYEKVRAEPLLYGGAYIFGGASPAWENVNKLVSFAVRSGRAKIVPVSKAQKGDIIVADWGGGKPGTPAFHGSHSMIVTGHTRAGNPLIASHGSNRYNFPLYGSAGSASVQGIERKAGKHPTFIALHIVG